ncbi:MAG: ATP-binding protein [Ignavibacteria bacterium]|jgi:anti-sigma regulatory factor (Ser/Thr protein kinase)|nr:ATP-binding protein [Ignavibacteria bacterium]
MNDLSLHILDISENSIEAGAENIDIKITEDEKNDMLTVEINDDGKGIKAEMMEKITDPFTTSRKTRSVGLGIPLFKEAAENSGGKFSIESIEGKGTRVKAEFKYSHIDRKPIGNMPETLIAIILRAVNTDIAYSHRKNGKDFVFRTKDLKDDLKIKSLNEPGLLKNLKEILNHKISELQ